MGDDRLYAKTVDEILREFEPNEEGKLNYRNLAKAMMAKMATF
jgi:Ca2+-binding EF-hand superfamily protein